ncbi:MlaD family protein [Vaginella massiliensis]|uniref:MlaD family protein n=1 Tax=Vaginella massiliensis TaxID=1816680 RepID=UPI0008396976|nr:MlaD family protein [Vaginella massiliensis]
MKISNEVKIGAVTLITIVSFFMLYNFLRGSKLFSRGTTYYAEYENVSGLQPTKPVSINGLKVGKVDEIKIIQGQPLRFLVKFTVTEDVEFSKNTVAQIFSPGIMQSSELQLLLDYQGEMAKDGDYLKSSVNAGLLGELGGQIEPTQQKLDTVLVTLDRTLKAVEHLLDNDNQQNIKILIDNLNRTVGSFNETARSFSTTASSADGLIRENQKILNSTLTNANSMLASAKVSVDKFGNTADKLNNLQLEQTLANFETASKDLKDLMSRIERGDGTLGGLLNDKTMYNNLNEATKNLNELMLDLKQNPNRYVNFSVFGKKAN